MSGAYVDTVRLLLDIIPGVFDSGRFALKGGTALNLFVREMPHLSVDIDVAYIDHGSSRETAINIIGRELDRMAEALQARGLRAQRPKNAQGEEMRIRVANATAMVKVEVNFVFPGTVLPIQALDLVASAQDLFTTSVRVPSLAVDELYGSKLVAAMDGQHPRDIFDVMHMLNGFGWREPILDCFVAYLAGHNRPIHEVLFANPKPLAPAFGNEFAGMAREDIRLETLADVQDRVLDQLPGQLLPRHREFLLSLAQSDPDWTLMPYGHLRELPAIKWKLLNLAKLKKAKPEDFATQHGKLARYFGAVN